MAIRVVTSAHVTRHGLAWWRAVRTALGWALTVGGLLVAVPMLGLIVATIGSGTASGQVGTMVLYLILGAGAVVVGRRLIRGRRRLVLFLWRFGFTGSTRALSFAVGTVVGRRFRAVTLDDAELAPVGSRRWARWLLAAATLASLVLLVVIAAEFISWVSGDAVGDLFTSTFEGSRAAAAQRGDNPIGAFIGAIFVAIVVAMMAGVFVMALLTMFFAVVGSSAVVSAASWIGVIRAEFAKRTSVGRPGDIERATVAVSKRARSIFAPRLVVVSSASAVWRDVVRRLAGMADILLIDVSVASDNLLWEIATLRPDHDRRWILIGRSDKIAELTNRERGGPAGAAKTLADLLDGQEILVYETESRAALRQFARALRATCENVAARAG